jgi:hypothetical protein
MAQPSKTGKKSLAQQQRHARLAAELRSNLHKRKAQARGRVLRGESDAGGKPSGLPDWREDPDGAKDEPA